MYRTDYNVAALVKAVVIRVSRRAARLSPGEYRSAFKGQGLNFAEVREYTYGDDIKDIDWNVTARMGHPYVKLYTEERRLHMLIVADISPSMYFGIPGRPKLHLLWETAALTVLLAIRNNDKISMVLFDDRESIFLRSPKGRNAGMAMLYHLINESLRRKTMTKEKQGWNKTIERLQKIKKNTVVFILSDFLFPLKKKEADWISTRMDAYWFQIGDIMEQGLSMPTGTVFEDMETGDQRLIGPMRSDWRIRDQKDIFARFRRQGRYLDICTTDPLDQKLIRFFRMRAQHKRYGNNAGG